MSGRVFVDTNVFVYLFESDEPVKQGTARDLLERLAGETGLVVSTQVLLEFYVSVTGSWPSFFRQPRPSKRLDASRRTR